MNRWSILACFALLLLLGARYEGMGNLLVVTNQSELSATYSNRVGGRLAYAEDTDTLWVLDSGTWRQVSGEGIPAGNIAMRLSACPTGWSEVGSLAGKVALGTTDGAGDVTTTGGADSVTPTFTGAASTVVVNHTHGITDPGHTHTIASQTATTGSASSWEHGAIDTSSAAAETLPTGSSTTGITATGNPQSGGAANYTPAGTISAIDNRSAFVRVIFCQKT